jgi:D-alanyl-D-alanine carboxypeptidase
MKEYCDNNNFGSEHNYYLENAQREKPKRHSHRSKRGLLVLCCLAVFIVSVGLCSNNFSFITGEQANENLSDKALTTTDFSIVIPTETSSIADAAQIDTDAAPGNIIERPDNATGTQNSDAAEWNLILINKWNVIPNDYVFELKELSNGQSVDVRIYPALQEMFDSARSEGVYPIVLSGYRTAEKQQSMMDNKIAEYMDAGYSAEEAKTKAEGWVAVPGSSEHQIGIAIDIDADDTHSTDEEVYAWFKQNSYKYGFIYRYAGGKTEITGTNDEPWHFRYVGVNAATEMYNRGICLEEYLRETN